MSAPLDPDTPKGQQVAEALSEVFAEVIARLMRENPHALTDLLQQSHPHAA